MKRLILLFLLLCTAPATRAENWVPVATVQHGEIQVDLDSVQVHKDGQIHYWARQILNEQGVNFFRILYHQPIGLIKVYDIADCSAQQLHTPYKIAYRDLESREPAILESMDNITIGLISNHESDAQEVAFICNLDVAKPVTPNPPPGSPQPDSKTSPGSP